MLKTKNENGDRNKRKERKKDDIPSAAQIKG
jgi:hypothetical protein